MCGASEAWPLYRSVVRFPRPKGPAERRNCLTTTSVIFPLLAWGCQRTALTARLGFFCVALCKKTVVFAAVSWQSHDPRPLPPCFPSVLFSGWLSGCVRLLAPSPLACSPTLTSTPGPGNLSVQQKWRAPPPPEFGSYLPRLLACSALCLPSFGLSWYGSA